MLTYIAQFVGPIPSLCNGFSITDENAAHRHLSCCKGLFGLIMFSLCRIVHREYLTMVNAKAIHRK